MVMMLYNLQWGMQNHPMDEVGKLAHTAACAALRFSVGNGKSLKIALFRTERTDEMPKGKGFAGTDQDAGDLWRGKRQIDRFVFLQIHVDIAQLAANQGLVPIDEHRQWLVRFFGSKCFCRMQRHFWTEIR